MLTKNNLSKDVLKILLKNFSANHTVSSLSQRLKISRVGIWKVLKILESDKLIILTPIGKGKTSAYYIKLNWDNFIVEKTLALILAEESNNQERWRFNFAELEERVGFLLLFGSILHSPNEANDIDIISVVTDKKKFTEIYNVLLKIQKTQLKKIHSIDLTENELEQELKKDNNAYIDALSKGVVLYGQENFVQFIKKIQTK
jgi:DNA-binding Lrp family transcriptional regulator